MDNIFSWKQAKQPGRKFFQPFVFFSRIRSRILIFVFLGILPLVTWSMQKSLAVALPKRDLVIAIMLEPPHLDPVQGAAGAIDEVVYANIFEGLTRIGEKGEVLPALAKNWEMQDNGKTFVFHLHQNARFHNGASFSAEDVKYSLNKARGEDSVNAQKNLFKDIENIEISDPFTIKITLQKPCPDFPWNMAAGDAVIIEKKSSATNRQHPVGTGPFRFESWKKGSSIILVRNKDWRGPSPFLERIEFRFITDPMSALIALLAREIHAFPFFPAPEAYERIIKDKRFQVIIGHTQGETILAINHKRPPFNNLKLRKAIAYAVDREAVIEGATFGQALPIGSHCLPEESNCQELAGTFIHNPQKAKELLQEIKTGKEKPFSLLLPPLTYARRSGEIISLQLQQAGIRVKIIHVEWAEWLEKVFGNHDFDLTIVSHTEPGDIDIYSRENYYLGYKNQGFNEMLANADTVNNPKEKKAILEKAQKILTEDVAAVFLFSLPKMGVWDKRLKGLWKNAPLQANDLSNVRWEEGKEQNSF